MIFRRLRKSTREEEEQFENMLEEEKVGWKDRFAMMISAYVTLVIPSILVLLLLCGTVMWLMGLL
jgi:hypothetical protein